MMGTNAHFKVGIPVAAVLLVLIFLISLGGFAGEATGQTEESVAPFYKDRVVKVQFTMPEEDWTYLCEHAREEDYVKADMWFDDELIPDIALRPKGNSSLATTISSGSIRFSLSRYTSEKEIDYTLSILPEIIDRLLEISPFWDNKNNRAKKIVV